MILVLTCEHAVADVPEKYLQHFDEDLEVLKTHEAFDPGSHDLYKHLESLADYSKKQTISRLVVETNRSLNHPKLFSRFVKQLSIPEKESLINKYYKPYREEIENKVDQFLREGNTVMHISVHSFTPILNGIERNCDIGLLYDSSRRAEKDFCSAWKMELKTHSSYNLNVRYNYPYLGKADGFTTFLRKKFGEDYLGIELEMNQKFRVKNKFPEDLKNIIFKTLKKLK